MKLFYLTGLFILGLCIGATIDNYYKVRVAKTISIIAEKKDCEDRGGEFNADFHRYNSRFLGDYAKKEEMRCDFPQPPAPPSIDYLKPVEVKKEISSDTPCDYPHRCTIKMFTASP